MPPEIPFSYSEHLTGGNDFEFSMRSNGFEMEDGEWRFNPTYLKDMGNSFRGQAVSFFGPGGTNIESYPYFHVNEASSNLFQAAMSQQEVLDTVAKYRRISQPLAGRVAYQLGGIVRDRDHKKVSNDRNLASAAYVARMSRFGDEKSGDAVTSAIARYVLSTGSFENDQEFTGATYHMSESISEDPVIVEDTIDLGLSQVARLRGLLGRINKEEVVSLPNVHEELEAFESDSEDSSGFPTVGAEFHLPERTEIKDPTLMKRLAILNMSQYQRGSFIQMSRNDRGVIEIRMNPSVYPVTIANYELLKRVIPEVEKSFFTITFNTPSEEKDFDWKRQEDYDLIYRLRKLGLLTYSTQFQNAPIQEESGEIDFGDIYLGQTIKTKGGNFMFTGLWSEGKGTQGQLGMYMGYGANFRRLAFYVSMGLVSPDVLVQLKDSNLRGIRKVRDALRVSAHVQKELFSRIHDVIDDDVRLKRAVNAGNSIVHKLAL